MIEGYKILTVTHHTEQLNKLGHYAFGCDDTELPNQLQAFKEAMQLEELLYLSTCNRILYFFYTQQDLTPEFVQSFFQQVNPDFDLMADCPEDDLHEVLPQKIKTLDGRDAIMHLLEVAASMNSLVIGEREILRQLRTAYQKCTDYGLTGDHIRIAMRAAVEGAKSVYANTKIGEKPVSIVSLAIQKLLVKKLSRNSRILMVGAGQTNALVAKFLTKHDFKNVTVFNRSLPRAEQLAEQFEGQAFPLSELDNYKEGFDILIVCTGATEAIIRTDLYQQLVGADKSEKFLIDLSIPNNISRAVVDDFNVDYVEIDNLRQLAKANVQFRQQEVVRGRQIIVEKLNEFAILHRQRQITKALRHVPEQIKAVRTHAIDHVFKKDLEHVDDDTRQLIDRMLTYMEKQCIGIPMKAAKESS